MLKSGSRPTFSSLHILLHSERVQLVENMPQSMVIVIDYRYGACKEYKTNDGAYKNTRQDHIRTLGDVGQSSSAVGDLTVSPRGAAVVSFILRENSWRESAGILLSRSV